MEGVASSRSHCPLCRSETSTPVLARSGHPTVVHHTYQLGWSSRVGPRSETTTRSSSQDPGDGHVIQLAAYLDSTHTRSGVCPITDHSVEREETAACLRPFYHAARITSPKRDFCERLLSCLQSQLPAVPNVANVAILTNS